MEEKIKEIVARHLINRGIGSGTSDYLATNISKEISSLLRPSEASEGDIEKYWKEHVKSVGYLTSNKDSYFAAFKKAISLNMEECVKFTSEGEIEKIATEIFEDEKLDGRMDYNLGIYDGAILGFKKAISLNMEESVKFAEWKDEHCVYNEEKKVWEHWVQIDAARKRLNAEYKTTEQLFTGPYQEWKLKQK